MSAPDSRADLAQVERYEFTIEFADAPFPGLTLDEPPPVGGDAGPNPVQSLVMAVGHCMSSTLFNTLSRARVAAAPIRTTVTATIGTNEKGRRRVRELRVQLHTRPLNEADRAQFDRCVEIFADYCTVSGAVREGVTIDQSVTPA
jgi:uncharacterized OsmC-like protein